MLHWPPEIGARHRLVLGLYYRPKRWIQPSLDLIAWSSTTRWCLPPFLLGCSCVYGHQQVIHDPHLMISCLVDFELLQNDLQRAACRIPLLHRFPRPGVFLVMRSCVLCVLRWRSINKAYLSSAPVIALVGLHTTAWTNPLIVRWLRVYRFTFQRALPHLHHLLAYSSSGTAAHELQGRCR